MAETYDGTQGTRKGVPPGHEPRAGDADVPERRGGRGMVHAGSVAERAGVPGVRFGQRPDGRFPSDGAAVP